MGVPKFYRWISERYPCLSEVVKEYQVPEFDNLYLDMNGIIHVCSHPNDDDPHFRITEEQIFKDIFHYIEVLFRIVRPKKVFFMAVDGVAPRAKMNQQRGRRFRSAKEAEENIKKAIKKGETLPDEKRFDSNCITPGTKFMVRLQQQLEYMVKSKVTTDPAWQGIRIFLSGHETPGEGEHKITEFIRHERMQSSYDPNTRHCLYGLDADLMMLGLCSHEPHFSLLREEVRFTGKKNKNARTPKPEETTFHLLHLSLMREYIDHEFESLKNTLPFNYDLEAIIDDWVLMGFLVGNDFIPHLPHLHIAHNALPMLYKTYIQVLPTLDGYLNEGGVVNLQRFEKYLEKLAKHDLEKFEEHYADFKWLESKTGKRKLGKSQKIAGAQTPSKPKAASNELDSFSSLDGEESTDSSSREQVLEMRSIKVATELSQKQGLMSSNPENESEDHSTFDIEFKLFKRNYYQEKLHFQGTDGEVAKIAFEYILAIQWICHYYYNGVQSWSWYYPYHYAPFLSDLRNLSKMKLTYDMGIPFMPYQQLLAVLPAASKECLPEPFWELMCSQRSPIIDYYPVDFTCDLNGKQQEWEAVVLIPFINENRLIEAMEPPIKRLKKDEAERNRHSGCHLYTYDNNLDYKVKSSLEGTFPNIEHCKAKLDVIPLHSWSSAEISQFVKGVLSGCRLSVYYPGFPTLYHLPHKTSLRKQGVKVFQMPSKNDNTILTILSPNDASNMREAENQPYKAGETLDDVAKNLLGTSIFVNWPHMEEAKVVAISDARVKYEVTEHIHATGSKGSKHKMQRKTLSNDENRVFRQDCESVAESYISRRGIDVGKTDFIVYAQPLLGRKYICGMQGQITLEKQWATKPNSYALQATVKDISVKDPTFQQFKGIDELYPVGSTVFMLGHPYYGCQGKVLVVKQSMTSIEFETPCEPDIDSVIRQRQRLSTAYYPGWELGSRVGVSNYLISRITGTIFVFYPTNRKWQIGLNLRFSRESSGVAGYTKLGDNRTWMYSEAVEQVLREYMEKFPEVLTYLQSALQKQENEFDAEKMTQKTEEADIIAKLQELSTWLKSLDCYHRDKVNEHSDMLEPKVVNAVVEKVEDCKKKKMVKPVQITIRPHILYRPLAHQGTLIPDKTTQHRLLDRIVNVRDGYTVPLGLRGTIIGVHKQPGQDVLYDVIFDEEFLGGLEFGGRCPKRRGYRMPECAMINLFHGGRISSKDHKPTAVVRPQNKQFTRQTWQPHNHNTYQRDQRPYSSREQSPRHARMNYEVRQPHREVQRPITVQQRSTTRTVMQRPSTNTVQTSRSQPVPKVQHSTQQSGGNMFDTLWNTLKEQNKKSNNAESKTTVSAATTTATRPKNIKNNTQAAKSNSVPNITPPQIEKKQSANAKSEGNISLSTTLTSLTQAAKSLPKVDTVTQSSESKTDKVQTAATAELSQGSTDVKNAKLQQTSTSLTTTVTQSQAKPSSGNEDVDHLNNLFNSIKVSQPQAPAFAPRFAFNPRKSLPHDRSPRSSPSRSAPPLNYPMQFHPRAPPFIPQNGPFNPMWSRPNFNQMPPFYQGQDQFYPHPQNFTGYPGSFGNRPMTRNPMMSAHQEQSFTQWHGFNEWTPRQVQPPQSMTGGNFAEGTQKLCEMLHDENEDASSSNWSKGEEEDDIYKETKEENKKKENEEKTDEIVNKVDNISMKDEASSSDGDSVKDDEEYMERSTSVEDEKTAIIKKQTKVDELISLCQKCNMMPPIYTYFTTGDEQVVSTVQLWNGVRFSSHPQITRDKAMEEAAGQAIGYLKTEQRDNRPVSTSPPSTLPYYFPVQSLVQPQYYQTHPAYAPVSYSTVPPQTYFLPSVPYAMVQQPVVSTIPTEFQQQSAIMQHHYRIDAPGQYNPYFQQYPPLVRVQVSPTHRAKSASPVYHSAAVGKGMWANQYQIRDKANMSRKTTEYKLLDEPPTSAHPSSQLKEEQKEQHKSSTKNEVEHLDSKESSTKKSTTVALPKKQNTAKPKLAISFNKAQTRE